MKVKLLTLLAAIFLLTNVTFGQSVGEYRVRKTETITKKIEKPKVIIENNPERKGFFVIPEVGIGIDFDYVEFSPTIHGVFGYEFNNHFALGIGTGLNAYRGGYYVHIPIYLNIRGDLTRQPIIRDITPYYSIDLGWSIAIDYQATGMTHAAEIGIRHNNAYLGINLNYADCRPHSAVISIKLGRKIPLKIGR